MDAKWRQVVEWLLEEARVEWTTERPAPGSEPEARELFISVGSRSEALPPHPRMLAWKLPQWTRRLVRSTTGAVLLSAEALDAFAQALREGEPGGGLAPLRLRVHVHTIDVVCASLLAAFRLLHGSWPEAAGALAEYLGEWEQGHTETVGDYERALGTVFYASLNLWPSETARPTREVLELMARVLETVHRPAELAKLPEALVPLAISRRLKADEFLYRAELSRAQRVQLDIPFGDAKDGPVRRVDALFLSSFQDVTVLRLLARGDTEHTHYGQGFDFMAVHIARPDQSKPWHAFSLNPERAGTLSDLAGALDGLEGDRLPDGTPRARGGRRFERQPNDYSDPWYSDGYASPIGRATMVAVPYSGTRLSRRELWEFLWHEFNVGRNVHVLRAHTLLGRPFLWRGPAPDAELLSRGFRRCDLSDRGAAFHPAVVNSFLGATEEADVMHYEKTAGLHTARVSVYPNRLVVVWVEWSRKEAVSLYALAQEQAALVEGAAVWELECLRGLAPWLAPLGPERWLVYGAYRISRGRSSMLDDSRSMQGLFHALASGTVPSLEKLPSEAAAEGRRVLRDSAGETEHWLTSTGGARIEFLIEEEERSPLACDRDFLLFLLTLGQRYSAFETSRRMAEVEQRYRTSRWQSLRPARSVRSDVMLFTNSLWHTRVSEDPDINARYLAWHSLHGMQETVEAMKDQAAELDQYKRDQFDRMVSILLFVFLPVSLACGFFSGAQFQDMSPSVGIPGTTTGWVIFLGYTAAFTVLVFGTVLLARMMNWRRR
ncbi:hypothetical protein [Stigmatella aurantiaca]|uniref:CorA-like Mg2+ transporter protein n=1 Tax=Stigmatella aurantiaca (strain DW4/3-1) TaxID=378806 RepID=Q095Z8_STIAD|nr:hypothetical protein [Stigmatella aurantiaca]ADO74934.1 uncharacterized protein STAUR_7178 [Stigmatella aurantiaca DW4/3-1]EAU67553.1 hypothetical protein STIAU_5895 [Stigmatella aurantiaca DW4/3-1]